MDLLKEWDTHEATNKTFHFLTLRLKEISRSDLADKLSRAVFHEKSEAVKHDLLNNPLQDLVKDPSLQAPVETKLERKFAVSPPSDSGVSPWAVFFVISGLATCFVFMGIIIDKFIYPITPVFVSCEEDCRKYVMSDPETKYTPLKGSKIHLKDPKYHKLNRLSKTSVRQFSEISISLSKIEPKVNRSTHV